MTALLSMTPRPPVLSIVLLGGGRPVDGDAAGCEGVEWLELSDAGGRRSTGPGGEMVLPVRTTHLGGRLNVAISQASGDWILALFGDELLREDWLPGVLEVLRPDGEFRTLDVLACHAAGVGALPMLMVRRQAFVYGAVDESFCCERLVLWHWLYRIYQGRRQQILKTAGIARVPCHWIDGPQALRAASGTMAALVSLGAFIEPDVRLALLEQTLSVPDDTIRSLRKLREETLLQLAGDQAGNPYRSGDYQPKRFWEDNTQGYVRWEAYQPDEPEIIEVVRRTGADSVLELGCGAGRNARYFAGAARYAGIDISMNLLMRAFDRQPENSLGSVCGTITHLPFASAGWELVFADSTVQHVIPTEIETCVAELVRVSNRFICLIEYTAEESPDGSWFKQVHMFPHDYRALFDRYCKLVWHTETSLRVHPARKEVFLFEKR